jgi:hypothetical protein
MKNWILKSYKNGSLFLILWLVTGLFGSIQKYYSPLSNQYLYEMTNDIPPPAKVIYGIFTLPPVVMSFKVILASIIFELYQLFYKLLKKHLPKIVKTLVLLLVLVSLVYTTSVSFDAIQENLKWGFYILVLQDAVWLVYIVFVVLSYWNLLASDDIK